MTFLSRSASVAAAASLLLLVGCSSTSTAGPGPAQPTSSASPSVSASPTPTADAPPELSSLTLTTEGLGSLVIGSPVPDQDSPASLVTWDAEYCEGLPTPDGNWAGAFVPAYPQADSPALGEREVFVLVTEDGTPEGDIAALRMLSAEVVTEEKIGVGSTREELLAAYPSFDDTTAEQLSDTYAINGEAGRLVFEVAKEPAAPFEGYWEADLVDTVLWMSVLPAGTPLHALAGGDGGGPCVV